MKVNPKNFTEEQAIEIALRQDCRCAVCGKKAAKLLMIGESAEIVWMADIHHRKAKSVLSKEDLKAGSGAGINNGVLLCRFPCHDNVHAHPNDCGKLMLKSWEPIEEEKWDNQ